MEKSMKIAVYGGGEAGLMGAVAKEVHDAGCEAVGIVPGNVDFIKDRSQPYVTELITTENMSDRKAKMLELADVKWKLAEARVGRKASSHFVVPSLRQDS